MKKEKVIEFIKIYRLYLPFGIYLILQFVAAGVGKLTDSALRSIPRLLLFWIAVIASLLLLLAISRDFFEWGCKKGLKGFMILKKIWYALLGIIATGMLFVGFLISVFMYKPEHIVVHNGVRMVASVNSFLQEQVSYYEYKNLIFRGSRQIGYEDYGNGGRDPLEDENREPIQQYFDE